MDSPDEIRRKIKIAVTDSGQKIKHDEKTKPAVSNLITIYGAFSGLSHQKIERKYRGQGYAEFKKDLAELLIKKLSPIQKKYRELSRNETKIQKILKEGADKASALANRTLLDVKRKVGFVL